MSHYPTSEPVLAHAYNTLEQLSVASPLHKASHMFTLPHNANYFYKPCRLDANSGFESYQQQQHQLHQHQLQQQQNLQVDEPTSSAMFQANEAAGSGVNPAPSNTTNTNNIHKFLENFYKNSSELVNLLVKQEFSIEEKEDGEEAVKCEPDEDSEEKYVCVV